jgi:Protein of unknown function DUF262
MFVDLPMSTIEAKFAALLTEWLEVCSHVRDDIARWESHQPQRLVVPLFQRRYVWNEESQWDPLWNDLVRVAERYLNRRDKKYKSHFLGAVVLQQAPRQIGLMQERTIIDGQQRLTTLQLLLDALAAELQSVNAAVSAKRIEPLVTNDEPKPSLAPFHATPKRARQVEHRFAAARTHPLFLDEEFRELARRADKLSDDVRGFVEMRREFPSKMSKRTTSDTIRP